MRKTLLVAVMALASSAAFAQTTDSTMAAPVPPPAAAPAPTPAEPASPTQTLAELISADTSLSIFKQALEKANLFGSLGQAYEAGYTVLAPTNAAFRKLTDLQGLLGPAQTQILYTTLMYHVVPGKYLAVHFPQLQSIKSWQGSDIAIKMMGESAMLGSSHLVGTEVPATNGVLHQIDTVLTVPSGGSNP